MIIRGDSEKQAILRDKMIKESDEIRRDPFVLKISSVIKPRTRTLDIGCGTAHIIQELATHHKNASFIGIDISSAMIKTASRSVMNPHNLILVEGDGLRLPFPDCSFDIVISIETDNFFIPKSLSDWKKETSQRIRTAGFIIESMEDFKEEDHYENEEELMNLIEMVPLVRDFDRERDKKRVSELVEKYREERGVKVTWHYYILVARRA
jgi:SAM-dependent methyltransferase